jgi:hypothetical protein
MEEFCQLLDVQGGSDVRQIEIHTAEPLVLILQPNPFEVGIAIVTLEKYKSPANDHIPTKLIQAGGETLNSDIH